MNWKLKPYDHLNSRRESFGQNSISIYDFFKKKERPENRHRRNIAQSDDFDFSLLPDCQQMEDSSLSSSL